jgi:hypothetical protein
MVQVSEYGLEEERGENDNANDGVFLRELDMCQ